jgi:hypothetical protein
MADRTNDDYAQEISRKLNVLIALSLRQLLGDKEISKAKGRRKQGASELIHFLADMGLDSSDIAEIVGSPLTSVRTLLTPKRRK